MKLLLRERIWACLLRYTPSGFSTYRKVRLRGSRLQALYTYPSTLPRYKPS